MSLNERIGFTQCTGFPSSSTQQETLSTACCVAKLCCKALQEPRSKCTLQLRTKTVNGLSFSSIGLQEQSRCTGLHNYNVHEMPHCWNPTMNPCSGMRHSGHEASSYQLCASSKGCPITSLFSSCVTCVIFPVSLLSFLLCHLCLFTSCETTVSSESFFGWPSTAGKKTYKVWAFFHLGFGLVYSFRASARAYSF